MDPGSFESLGQLSPPRAEVGLPDYLARLSATRDQTGLPEAIVTGTALIDGYECVVIASAFEFLAGSIGQVAADSIVAAYTHATDVGLPVLALPCSGGTRMQEGTSAFFRMIDIAEAAQRHRRSGNLSIAWMRNPTTGGVLASWGSLGQITFAEPGALVGFLGPRIFETLTGEKFPEGIQTSESLARAGVVDGVVALNDLRVTVATILDVDINKEPTPVAARPDAPEPSVPSISSCLASTERINRPGFVEFISQCTEVTELHGTTQGERSDMLRLALARIDGVSCIVVGQDRSAQASGASLGPSALRQARRGFALADELGLPIVTIVDTTGAELSVDAELGALACEIACCMADLGAAVVPSVGVVLGRGCGGGALALLATDAVIAAQHAWVSPLPLEGASAIRFRSANFVDKVAVDLGIDAHSLQQAGVVDLVVAEVPDAADEPVEFIARLISTVGGQLRDALHG